MATVIGIIRTGVTETQMTQFPARAYDRQVKKLFYEELGKTIRSGAISSPASVDIEDPTNAFYELCRCYANVALNTVRWQKPVYMHKFEADYKETELDRAVEWTLQYADDNEIGDVNNLHLLLKAVRTMHPFAAREDDERADRNTAWQDESENARKARDKYGYCFSRIFDGAFNWICDVVEREFASTRGYE